MTEPTTSGATQADASVTPPAQAATITSPDAQAADGNNEPISLDEAKKLRAEGTEVVLIQPTEEDLEAMGRNLMNRARRHEVIERAIDTIGAQLREPGIGDALRDLPAGEPHKIARPDGPPSTWPPIVSAVRRERAA